MTKTLQDKNGTEIKKGDFVSLAGNITADNSMGDLPNGWIFDEVDVYEVVYDEMIDNWSLDLGVKPNSRYNVKYMNHALGLLHDRRVEIVAKPEKLKADEVRIEEQRLEQEAAEFKEFVAFLDTVPELKDALETAARKLSKEVQQAYMEQLLRGNASSELEGLLGVVNLSTDEDKVM